MVSFAYVFAVGTLKQVVLNSSFNVFAGAIRIVFLNGLDEVFDVVKFTVLSHKTSDAFRALVR